jgi:hypothetical protein
LKRERKREERDTVTKEVDDDEELKEVKTTS